MKKCGAQDADAGLKCQRPKGHTLEHRANGLVWQNAFEHRFSAPPPPDPVNHPAHYTSHTSGIECIEIVRHMNFNRGNAVKYIWRAGEKGPAIEDLKKAIWLLQDEIKRLERN
jgi:hypothetical protein